MYGHCNKFLIHGVKFKGIISRCDQHLESVIGQLLLDCLGTATCVVSTYWTTPP